jgi:hypothetical protein
VKEVRLIIRTNQADNGSTLKGISPKKTPPFIIYSNPSPDNPAMAKALVTSTISETVKILTRGLNLRGTKGSAIIPDKKIISNALKKRPVNSFPSNTIIL